MQKHRELVTMPTAAGRELVWAGSAETEQRVRGNPHAATRMRSTAKGTPIHVGVLRHLDICRREDMQR
jgi:hypothetical protein